MASHPSQEDTNTLASQAGDASLSPAQALATSAENMEPAHQHAVDGEGHGETSAVSDSELSTDDFRTSLHGDILGALEAIQTTRGSFAAFKPLSGQFNPQICVGGVGDIQLPLAPDQARQIITKAQQAPYGKGSETLVDTSVRNTWELDPDRFEIKHPDWDKAVGNLTQNVVAKELGIDGAGIRAELYKMLLYEKGAMFKAHTDTEKIPGMFATMVISLPSAHEGGDVIVKHRGETKTLKTSSADVALLCWYSDVSHQVLPVTSGYRLVLTYNLALPPDLERPSAALLRDDLRPLRHLLRRWLLQLGKQTETNNTQEFKHGYFQNKTEKTPSKHLYYALDHEYTEAQISLKGLKTVDFDRVSALQTMSSELELDVFLAVLEKEELGSCEHVYDDYYDRKKHYRGYEDDEDDEDDEDEGDGEDWHELEDVHQVSYKIKQLVDLKGRVVLSDISTSEDFEENLLQEFDLWEGLEGEEEYEGFMGNSGPQATHWYRQTVAVIVPRRRLVEYLCSRISSPKYRDGQAAHDKLIEFFADRCGDPEVRPSAFAALFEICTRVGLLAPVGTAGLSAAKQSQLVLGEEALRKLLKACLDLGELDVFIILASGALICSQAIPVVIFHTLKEHIDGGRLQFSQAEKFLLSALACYRNIEDRYAAIKILVPAHNNIPATMGEFVRNVVSEAVQSCGRESKSGRDAHAMAEMIRYLGPESFRELFLPLVQQKIREQQAPFAMAALVRLHYLFRSGYFPDRDGQRAELFEAPAEAFVSAMDPCTFLSEDTVTQRATKAARLSTYVQSARTHEEGQGKIWDMSLDDLREFMAILVQHGHQALADRFFYRLVSQVDRIPVPEFHGLWLPLLDGLLVLLETADGVALATGKYRTVFTSILCTYLKAYVGPQPVATSTLVRPAVSCRCNDCQSLNAFLVDPSLKSGRFPMGKQRRQHLHQQLDRAVVDVTHETERWGNPQTLVVTKANRQQQARATAWKQRRAYAASRVLGLCDQDALRSVLGPEVYVLVIQGQPFEPFAPPPLAEEAQGVPGAAAESSGGGSLVQVDGDRGWRDVGQQQQQQQQQAAQPTPGLSGSSAWSHKYRPAQVAGVKRPAPGSAATIDLTGDSD